MQLFQEKNKNLGEGGRQREAIKRLQGGCMGVALGPRQPGCGGPLLISCTHDGAALGKELSQGCTILQKTPPNKAQQKQQQTFPPPTVPTGWSTPVWRKVAPTSEAPPEGAVMPPQPRREDPAEQRSTRSGPVRRHHLCMRPGVPGTGGTAMKNSWATGHRGLRDGAPGVPEMQGTPARPRNTDDEVDASPARRPRGDSQQHPLLINDARLL